MHIYEDEKIKVKKNGRRPTSKIFTLLMINHKASPKDFIPNLYANENFGRLAFHERRFSRQKIKVDCGKRRV